jgi:iron(III) transport system substrate-binding protein
MTGVYATLRSGFVGAVSALIVGSNLAFSAAAPMAMPQLALYQGSDREKILIEGAKHEGQFTLYTSHTWFKTFVSEFEKKYPFVRASQWRNDSKNIIRKVLEENKSGRALAEVVETTADGMGLLRREGLFQEYYSPEARFYPNELEPRGKSGFFYLPNRETYNNLGFNTNAIPPSAAPRTLKDLIDPKWKGKMAITSTSTGARWIGNVAPAGAGGHRGRLFRVIV